MRINSIKMVNWKCFDNRKITFDRLTLLNWQNGEGKTSLIQAIVLCLFDKRPDNLDYASLVDVSKPTKLTLNFTYNMSIYIVEREVGQSSGFRLYKDDELIGRSSAECKQILHEIIPSSILTSLWGYEPLAQSNVLNSNYLFEILDAQFKEPLELKQYFLSDRSYHQKHKLMLQKQIVNQKVSQEEIDILKNEIDDIESKIKEKAFISDDDIINAKKAKTDFETYNKLLSDLIESVPYDKETCIRIKAYGRTEEEWNNYFSTARAELVLEKSKANASPLTKYSKPVVSALIEESKTTNTCILCGGEFHEPELDYDTVDNNKIMRLEKLLEDEQYNFKDLVISMKYWHTRKLIDNVSYSKNVDFNSILANYDKETNELYASYNIKKETYTSLDKDLAKITELLLATDKYDQDKLCIEIVEKYIEQAKEHYANDIKKAASEILKNINSRYTEIIIVDGIYKVKLYDKNFNSVKTLAVQSLSKGEKTIVAFALIIAIRNIFMPNMLLIMDESFANLDANNLAAIKTIVNEDSNQWILVSHDERLI